MSGGEAVQDEQSRTLRARIAVAAARTSTVLGFAIVGWFALSGSASANTPAPPPPPPLVSGVSSLLGAVLTPLAPVVLQVVAPLAPVVHQQPAAPPAPVVQTIVTPLAPVVQTIVTPLAPVVQTIVTPLAPVVQTIVTPLAPVLQTLVPAVQQITAPPLQAVAPVVNSVAGVLPPVLDPVVGPVSAMLTTAPAHPGPAGVPSSARFAVKPAPMPSAMLFFAAESGVTVAKGPPPSTVPASTLPVSTTTLTDSATFLGTTPSASAVHPVAATAAARGGAPRDVPGSPAAPTTARCASSTGASGSSGGSSCGGSSAPGALAQDSAQPCATLSCLIRSDVNSSLLARADAPGSPPD